MPGTNRVNKAFLQKKKVENLLVAVKFPEFFTRALENLDVGAWKANQFRLWLFYYFVTCRGIVPKKYFDHFSLLAEAVSLLSTTPVAEHDLFVAETQLHKFCLDFSGLYGTSYADRITYGSRQWLIDTTNVPCNKKPSLSLITALIQNYTKYARKLIFRTSIVLRQLETSLFHWMFIRYLVHGLKRNKFQRHVFQTSYLWECSLIANSRRAKRTSPTTKTTHQHSVPVGAEWQLMRVMETSPSGASYPPMFNWVL